MKAYVQLSSEIKSIALFDVPIPEVGDSEVLVRVAAIGVGVHDEYYLPATPNYPYVIGIEAAGVIEKIGSAVSNFKIGERIAFVSAMQEKGGTWAEYAVISDRSLIVPIPNNMSFEEAAALPVAGNTILKAFHAANLKQGDHLFIAGGSGAIGTLAIQIAKERGYKIAASASVKNHDYMQQLGAEKVVDYNDTNWQQDVLDWCPDGVDAVIAIQPGTASDSESVVKDSGVIVAVSGDQFTPGRGINLTQISYQADISEELNAMYKKVVSGETLVTIEKVYPFKDGLEALEKVKTRHAKGKVVLKW